MRRVLLPLLCCIACAAQADGWRGGADVALETRYFFHNALAPAQRGSGVSLWARPELRYTWDGGDAGLSLVGFARWDQHDAERSHVDLRELLYRQRFDTLELRAGAGTVFWGTLESAHLVNIINQTDLVENPDAEDKLGQPMLRLAWRAPLGTLEGYLLPYFRERRLPGIDGRLRPPTPFDTDGADYESGDAERHVDGALRWSLRRGPLELNLAHFSGTARAPRFVPRATPEGPRLRAVYDLIEQTSVDGGYRAGAALLKFEAAHQHSRADTYTAAGAGLEWPLTRAPDARCDLALLAEYLWDERGGGATTPFQNDLYLAARLASNDARALELLAGVTADLDHDGLFGNLEASARVGEATRLVLELRLFERTTPGDPLFNLRQDDYLQLELQRYF